jgi:phosphoribosyl 1,2-cyclic phosphodiesterase
MARFWGVRGSIPTPGPATARYGGNTTCLELRIQGRIIIIDAGSGISPLGSALVDEFGVEPLSLVLLNTHTHWDHIQGFPFFIPAYMKNNRIRVLGRDPKPDSLKSIFQNQMDGNHCFPVPLEAMKCDMSFEHLNPDGEAATEIEGVKVATCPTNHPGGCLAYRFNTSGGSLVFLSDHETDGPDEDQILEFIRDADVLIADCQYTNEEIATRRGWGHGCCQSVVSLALKANIRRLYMTHHDPSHDDEFIDTMLSGARNLVPSSGSLEVFSATERETIFLTPLLPWDRWQVTRERPKNHFSRDQSLQPSSIGKRIEA